MMSDAGYIKGVQFEVDISGGMTVDADDISITLKGLEYLSENTIMQRMDKVAKGIRDIVPI